MQDYSAIARIQKLFADLEVHRYKRNIFQEEKILKHKDKNKLLSNTLKLKLNSGSSFPRMLNIDKFLIKDPLQICEALSDTFARSFNNTSHVISAVVEENIYQFSTVEFNEDNVREAIKSLEASSNGGVDEIPGLFIKHGSTDFPILLTKIFNLSMESGTYPDYWKTSHNIPHFKKGSRLSPDNYRPINITSVLSRVMEKVVKKVSMLTSISILLLRHHNTVSYLKSPALPVI